MNFRGKSTGSSIQYIVIESKTCMNLVFNQFGFIAFYLQPILLIFVHAMVRRQTVFLEHLCSFVFG